MYLVLVFRHPFYFSVDEVPLFAQSLYVPVRRFLQGLQADGLVFGFGHVFFQAEPAFHLLLDINSQVLGVFRPYFIPVGDGHHLVDFLEQLAVLAVGARQGLLQLFHPVGHDLAARVHFVQPYGDFVLFLFFQGDFFVEGVDVGLVVIERVQFFLGILGIHSRLFHELLQHDAPPLEVRAGGTVFEGTVQGNEVFPVRHVIL